MRKSIFDVNVFGSDKLGRGFNALYHMFDLGRGIKHDKDYLYEYE